jgi:hypothetical protein
MNLILNQNDDACYLNAAGGACEASVDHVSVQANDLKRLSAFVRLKG